MLRRFAAKKRERRRKKKRNKFEVERSKEKKKEKWKEKDWSCNWQISQSNRKKYEKKAHFFFIASGAGAGAAVATTQYYTLILFFFLCVAFNVFALALCLSRSHCCDISYGVPMCTVHSVYSGFLFRTALVWQVHYRNVGKKNERVLTRFCC